MYKWMAVVGIILVMIGTIISLLSILCTRTKDVGTCAWMNGERQQRDFSKQKIQVIVGITMIVLYTMSSIYHGLHPNLKAKKVF